MYKRQVLGFSVLLLGGIYFFIQSTRTPSFKASEIVNKLSDITTNNNEISSTPSNRPGVQQPQSVAVGEFFKTTTDTSGWNIYTSTEGGFSFSYPNNERVDDSNGNLIGAFYSPNQDLWNDLSFIISDEPMDTTVNSIVRLGGQNKITKISQNGNEGIQMTRIGSRGQALNSYYFFPIKRGNVWISAPQPKEGGSDQIFNDMMTTFQVSK